MLSPYKEKWLFTASHAIGLGKFLGNPSVCHPMDLHLEDGIPGLGYVVDWPMVSKSLKDRIVQRSPSKWPFPWFIHKGLLTTYVRPGMIHQAQEHIPWAAIGRNICFSSMTFFASKWEDTSTRRGKNQNIKELPWTIHHRHCNPKCFDQSIEIKPFLRLVLLSTIWWSNQICFFTDRFKHSFTWQITSACKCS